MKKPGVSWLKYVSDGALPWIRPYLDLRAHDLRNRKSGPYSVKWGRGGYGFEGG